MFWASLLPPQPPSIVKQSMELVRQSHIKDSIEPVFRLKVYGKTNDFQLRPEDCSFFDIPWSESPTHLGQAEILSRGFQLLW